MTWQDLLKVQLIFFPSVSTRFIEREFYSVQSYCTMRAVGIINLQSSSSSKKCQHLDSKISGMYFDNICYKVVSVHKVTKCLSAYEFDAADLQKYGVWWLHSQLLQI